MDEETCWLCVVIKYSFAVAFGFVLGIAWIMVRG